MANSSQKKRLLPFGLTELMARWPSKILLTGSRGIIGGILCGSLKDYQLVLAALPKHDVRNFEECLRLADGVDVVIHLAWDTKAENWKSERIDPGNTAMFENVYRAALEKGVRRVIMASSVHVERYNDWSKKGFISPNQDAEPDSPYGAHKIFMEKLGRWYATKGLEVICVRFGGVCPLDVPPWKDLGTVGLTHPDCADLIKSCLTADSVPSNFSVFYGVSDNKRRIHDYSNPFGWKPKQNADVFYKLRI